MLDFQPQIFSRLSLHLQELYEDIYTSRSETTSPPRFPAVTIVQKDNVNYQRTMDACHENHVKVMYQVDIYTNDQDELDRIQLADSISHDISDFMIGLGFNRTMCQPVPNVANMSIYRISMRFEGVIGKDAIVYSE